MKDIMHRPINWQPGALILVGITLLVAALALSQAAPAQAGAAAAEAPTGQQIELVDNAACLACHGQTGQVGQFPNTTLYSATILKELYGVSVHSALECTKCHTGLKDLPPHRDLKAIKINDERDYALSYKDACKECHAKQYAELQDSMHTKFMVEQGNLNAPVCNDCHNPHVEVKSKDAQGNLQPQARAEIAKTCAKCHDAIFKAYAESVHGKGVLSANNPDVPTCTDCHGVHAIVDARSAAFRNSSIELCAKCHTNEQLMSKYKLSTAVMNTYVADFHGTTVTLFERQSPDEPTNKPVCYDCHGVHSILRASDPEKGLQVRSNLLKTCQRCHPEATKDFDASWLSHYIPSPTKYPLVYYVNLFYVILIPVVLGGMAMIISTDVYRRIRTRGKPTHFEEPPVEEAAKEAPQTPSEAKTDEKE